MTWARARLDGLPLPARCAVLGALLLGVPGVLLGVVLGLRAYAPTAWAAGVEVGLPAALLGALLGALVGLARLARRRTPRS